MTDFNTWLLNNHPELNENWRQSLGALAMGAASLMPATADAAPAKTPPAATAKADTPLQRLRDKQDQRRNWRAPLVGSILAAGAAAKAARRKKATNP